MRNITIMWLLTTLLLSCADREEARRPISHASGSFLKQSIEIGKEQKHIEEKLLDSIIKANTDKEYLLSQKGYWYTYLKQNPEEEYLPQVGDFVYFDSEIYSVLGDTIYKKGELPTREYMVDKEDIIIGLRDGLKRLKKGEIAQFLLPSHVAYGYVGDKKKIGRNVPLLYTVTIVDIKENLEDKK